MHNFTSENLFTSFAEFFLYLQKFWITELWTKFKSMVVVMEDSGTKEKYAILNYLCPVTVIKTKSIVSL